MTGGARGSDRGADRGLGAVARVRGVRERDSRLGLTGALADEHTAQARVLALEAQLASVTDLERGALTGFAAFADRHRRVAALSDALTAARATLDTARVVALAARDRWQSDQTRLAAVESLLDRRAEQRRQDERRREDRRGDAAAEDLWRRRNGAVAP